MLDFDCYGNVDTRLSDIEETYVSPGPSGVYNCDNVCFCDKTGFSFCQQVATDSSSVCP
jgi:hypothetical protein